MFIYVSHYVISSENFMMIYESKIILNVYSSEHGIGRNHSITNVTMSANTSSTLIHFAFSDFIAKAVHFVCFFPIPYPQWKRSTLVILTYVMKMCAVVIWNAKGLFNYTFIMHILLNMMVLLTMWRRFHCFSEILNYSICVICVFWLCFRFSMESGTLNHSESHKKKKTERFGLQKQYFHIPFPISFSISSD